MSCHVDTVALGWVRAPLARELASAEAALVEYSRDTGHQKPLLQCLWAMHHITATVRALRLHKVAMLTLEMERGLQRLYQGKVLAQRRNLTMGGLMRALRILPAYLDHVQRGGIDSGRGLEPCVNDLRRWEGERPRPRALFFHFDIPPERGISSGAAAVGDDAIRRGAQLALAPYLQGAKAILGRPDLTGSVRTVARIALKMQQLFVGTEAERFWLLQIGLCEGIAAGLIVPDAGVAQIFKAGTFMIKHALEHGGQLDPVIDLDVLAQQMLFYIAACQARPLYIGYLWQLFAITPDTQAEADRILIHSDALVMALEAGLERLQRLAVSLEAAAGDAPLGPEVLVCAAQAVDRLAAAGELGHADALQASQEMMRQLSESRSPDPSQRGQLVARLARVVVEAQLDLELRLRHGGWAPPGGATEEARAALVATTLASMVQVGQQLDAALRRQTLDASLATQRQGMAGMHELATVLNSYLNKSTEGHEVLREVVAAAGVGRADPVQLQALATEFAAGLQELPLPRVLEQCTQRLGVMHDALLHIGLHSAAVVIQRCGDCLASCEGQALEAELLQHIAAIFAQLELHLQYIREGAAAASAGALERASLLSESLWTPAAASGQQPLADTVTPPLDSIPAELRDIFLEESADLIAQLQQLVPAGDTAPPSLDELRDIRRHFHTFKGNGRALGAHSLADLGAAVQELLDRVLEADRAPDSALRSLLREVIEALPELVAGGGPGAADIAALRERCLQASRLDSGCAGAIAADSATATGDPPARRH